MGIQSRWLVGLWTLRGIGVFTIALILLAGTPRKADAFFCEYLITCSTAEACVAAIGNSCACGEVRCDVGPECSGELPVRTMCKEVDPD